MIGAMQPSSDGPVLGLAEAAKACGISVSTLRRKRGDLEDAGAIATPAGWRIPITALVSLGLMPATTPPPEEPRMAPTMQPPAGGGNAPADTLREELDALRSRLVAAEQRAAVAEAIAHERERVIEAQATALRMLEAPATSTATPTSESTPAAPAVPVPGQPQQPQRPTLWQRLRGASAQR